MLDDKPLHSITLWGVRSRSPRVMNEAVNLILNLPFEAKGLRSLSCGFWNYKIEPATMYRLIVNCSNLKYLRVQSNQCESPY